MSRATNRTPGAERLASGVAIALAVAAVVALALRSQYGIDLHDEASYAAIALRFAQGTKPLIGYLDSHQFSAYLLVPYMKLHLALFGREGLMLSLRILYVVIQTAVGALSFSFLRRYFAWRIALSSAALGVCCVPFLIPALSYNTMAVLFLAAASAFVGIGFDEKRGRRWFVAGGIALGLAGIAYPIAIVLGPLAALLVRPLDTSWRNAGLVALGWLAGALLGGAPFLFYLGGLSDFLAYNAGLLGTGLWANGLTKIGTLFAEAGKMLATSPAFWLSVILTLWSRVRNAPPQWLWIAVPLLLPVAPLDDRFAATLGFVTLACALVLAVATPVRGTRRAPLLWGLLLALGFGCIAGYTSGMSILAFGVGALSSVALGVALLLEHGTIAPTMPRDTGATTVLALGASAAILGVAIFVLATSSYLDGSPISASVRIPSGPYRGMLTTPERAEMTTALQSDLAGAVDPGDQVFSFFAFPAVHLFLDDPGPSRQIWLMPIEINVRSSVDLVLNPAFDAPDGPPDVVVVNDGVPEAWNVNWSVGPEAFDRISQDMRDALGAAGYTTQTVGPAWTVYRRVR